MGTTTKSRDRQSEGAPPVDSDPQVSRVEKGISSGGDAEDLHRRIGSSHQTAPPNKRIPVSLTPEREADFHFIWEQLHFDRGGLTTSCGKQLSIVHPGTLNTDQGPDFLQAKIELDGILLCGHVELHLDGQDWYTHRHDRDPGYCPVILHVVAQPSRRPPKRKDGTVIPELVLRERIHSGPLARIRALRSQSKGLACAPWLVKQIPHLSHKEFEQYGKGRLLRKAEAFRKRMQGLRGDWEQIIWEALARSFGGPVNGASFGELARALPWKVLRSYLRVPGRRYLQLDAVTQRNQGANILREKHQAYGHFPATEVISEGSRESLEALLFGVAGLLEDQLPKREPWPLRLRLEWSYLARKHRLRAQAIPWLHHRMRPASFPEVRLSQLAGFLLTFSDLATLLVPSAWDRVLKSEVGTARYWDTHSRLGKVAVPRKRALGASVRERFILNGLAPLALLYGEWHGARWIPGAIPPEKLIFEVLRGMPPEDNRIVRLVQESHTRPQNALQAQGALELYKMNCLQHNCLQCRIGRDIVGS